METPPAHHWLVLDYFSVVNLSLSTGAYGVSIQLYGLIWDGGPQLKKLGSWQASPASWRTLAGLETTRAVLVASHDFRSRVLQCTEILPSSKNDPASTGRQGAEGVLLS